MKVQRLISISNLVLITLISFSYQTTVDHSCSPSSADTLCYTISFTRSVLEGHDSTVTVNANKPLLRLTVFANTPYTHVLEGYKVGLGVKCIAQSNISIAQTAMQAIDSCTANMTNCGASITEIFLQADSSTINGNIFHATLETSSPGEDFELIVMPVFENGADSVYDAISSPGSPSFTRTPIGDVVSTGKSSECAVTRAPGPKGFIFNTAAVIAMAATFAVCLIIAAVVIKVYLLLKEQKKSNASVGSERMELGGVSDDPVEETSGKYQQY